MVARLPCHYATSRIARTATHGGSCKRQLLITKCNVQNYRLLLWFDKFENLLLNACPSYEVMECRKSVVLSCKILMSARPSYVPRIPYMEILGRAIYQNPRKSLRSSKGLYLNSHPCDTRHSKFSLDESTSVAACTSLLNKPRRSARVEEKHSC